MLLKLDLEIAQKCCHKIMKYLNEWDGDSWIGFMIHWGLRGFFHLSISFYLLDDGCLSLLGYDYVERLVYVKDQSKEPDLCSLGTALCEESRIKILKFLLEQEEVTCKDLEKEFSFLGREGI